MTESPHIRQERRSTRVEVEIPIVITSVKSVGGVYEGPGVTVMVNKHGAKIVTAVRFQAGDYVRLTIPASNRSQLARVAWVDQENRGVARVAFGIALEEPENFWGVYFPPGDWDNPPSWEDWEVSERQQVTALPARQGSPPPLASTLDPPAVAAATQRQVTDAPPIEIYEEGSPVYVRGMSAAHLPFQEQTWLHPLRGQELTIRLRAVVDIGRLLQVIVPTNSLVVRARTSGVSDRVQKGKWTYWLRLDAPIRIIPKTGAEE